MNTQIITSPTGERLVVLPEVDYHAVLSAAEDASDAKAVREFREKVASGEEELPPSAMVDRILNGESAVRVRREHRGISASELARQAGLAQPYVSQIERGRRKGTTDVMKRIAEALRISLDDLLG